MMSIFNVTEKILHNSGNGERRVFLLINAENRISIMTAYPADLIMALYAQTFCIITILQIDKRIEINNRLVDIQILFPFH